MAGMNVEIRKPGKEAPAEPSSFRAECNQPRNAKDTIQTSTANGREWTRIRGVNVEIRKPGKDALAEPSKSGTNLG
jgi:hypothetical protein